MPGVTRVLSDNAVGTILGPGAPTVKTEGQSTSVINDSVSPHGDPPHVSATIVSASSTVFAEGKPVSRIGDSMDFGALFQGSPNVFANG